MQLKPIVAITVLLLVITSMSVCGCTTNLPGLGGSSSPSGTVSTDYPTSGRSKLVEAAVEYKRSDYNTEYLNTKPISFDVTWITNTEARIHQVTVNTEDYTKNVEDFTITHHPSTEAATTYFFLVAPGSYSSGLSDKPIIDYYKITGKTPTVYKKYQDDWVGLKSISQFDSLVVERTLVFQKPN